MAAYTDNYTDRRRTRVYRPDNNDTITLKKDEVIGQTQAIAPKPKLFDGISAAQLIAGAAAAATSVALSSYIGVAGSIIGAAISSVVTVISSQLYRRFLDASARKIKDGAALAQATIRSDQTEKLSGTTVQDGDAAVTQGNFRGARLAPSKLRARAAAERAATQKKVIGFSVAAAVAAVVVCAGAIWLGTAGEGIGEKTAIIAPATVTDSTSETQTSTGHVSNRPSTATSQTQTDPTSGTATGDDATANADGTGEGTTTEQDGTSKDTSSDTSSSPETTPSTGSSATDEGTGSDAATGDSSSSNSGQSSNGNSSSSSSNSTTLSTGTSLNTTGTTVVPSGTTGAATSSN